MNLSARALNDDHSLLVHLSDLVWSYCMIVRQTFFKDKVTFLSFVIKKGLA